MMSNQFSSDILSTRCKALELRPLQDICFLKGSLSKLHHQLKNRSQLCKQLESLRSLDILSLLDNQGIMSSLIGSDIVSTRCKPLELRPLQDICFLKGSLSKLHHQLKNMSQACKQLESLRSLDILSLLDKQYMMSNQFSSDILSTRCKALELSLSQGIYIQWGSLSILHPQLKNMSQACKQ
jgi:hypothetical protein